MNKHFPKDMLAMATQANFKLILFSDPAVTHEMDCTNCGGLGFFNVFFADEGPYLEPAAPYRSDGKVSHWHDERWFVGKSYCFTCPDCNGEGRFGAARLPRKKVEVFIDDPYQEEMQAALDRGVGE